MKRMCLVGAAMFAAGFAQAATEPCTLENGVLTFDVDAADYPETAPYAYGQALPDEVTAIVKKGTGAADLGIRTNTTFTGTITIEENGGFLMGVRTAFGKPSTVTVGDKGAFELTECSNPAIGTGSFAKTKFYVTGSGPDGHGAIQRPNSFHGTDIGMIQYMELLGDTTLNFGSRWGMNGGTLVMNNHDIYLTCEKHNDKFTAEWSPIFNPGTLKIKDPGNFLVGTNMFFSLEAGKIVDAEGSSGTISNSVITLLKGARMRIFDVQKGAIPCKLVASENSTIQVYQAAPDNQPMKVSNYDGPIEIRCATLTANLYENNDTKENANFVFNNEVSGVGRIHHDVRGTMFFTGAHTNTLGGISQTATGKLYLMDDVHLNVTNGCVSVLGTSAKNPATLILSNNASIVELPTPTDRTKRARYDLGYDGFGGKSTGYGLCKVYDNSVVSNAFSMGLNGKGACYLFGGDMTILDGPSSANVGFIGHNGYGYLGIDGGTFSQTLWFYLGTSAPGFMIQRGGRAYQGRKSAGNPLRIGNKSAGSYAYYAVLGGTAVWRNYAAMNFANYPPDAIASTGVITVDGPDAVVEMNEGGIHSVPAVTTKNALVTAHVNLGHGGTLKVKYIAVEQIVSGTLTPAWDTIKETTRDATLTYVNFNGGILKTSRAGEFFSPNSGTDDPYRHPTRMTVYPEGAVIDTDGKDVTMRVPFEKPYGYGIKSVELPDEAKPDNVLIGPTRCSVLADKGGAAADVLMDFDDTNRVARSLMVISPGFGYPSDPVVTLQKADASLANVWTCDVETVDFDAAGFKHGGLTKRGAGTLTLTAANTYGGATRVEGGTLVFTDAAGLPVNSALEFSAAGLASGAKDAPLLTAPAYNGGEVRIVGAETLDPATFGKSRSVATFDTPLTTLPAVKLVKTDGTELAGCDWRLSVASGGKTLRFGASKGLMILLK